MKPDKATRHRDQYKRQLTMLEVYITGRIKQLDNITRQRPAESTACEMAQGELNMLLTQVLPEMRKVQS